MHHCPADFEPAEPGGPSSSVGIAFVISMRQATEDDARKPAKRRKISENAPHKKALARFLNILDSEKEGILIGGEARRRARIEIHSPLYSLSRLS
jgi:hypothetical protein